MTDVVKTAIEALKSGKDVNEAVYGSGSSSSASFGDHEEISEDILGSLGEDQGNTDQPSEDGDDSELDGAIGKATAKPKLTSDQSVETITVSDSQGRRKVKVDFSDRDKLKKHIQLAYGARKWQAERDEAIGKVQKMEQTYGEVSENWNAVEQAYAKDGVRGLVNLIEGKDTAFDDFQKELINSFQVRQNATPAELARMDAQERNSRLEQQLQQERKEREAFQKRIESEKDSIEMQAMESKVVPAYHKYAFTDKLGDPDTENMFNEMLWNTSLKRLEKYEEANKAVTSSLVEQEFKKVYQAIQKRIGNQTNKQVTKTVSKKKQEATENAQSAILSGYKGSATGNTIASDIKKGDYFSALKKWSQIK